MKTPTSGAPPEHGAERFIDVGVSASRVRADLQQGMPITTSSLGVGPHVGLGARRAVSANNDLGVRVEFDEVDGHSLIGVRAIDYRYRFGNHFALGLFAGAARYDAPTPAYGVYFGAGAIGAIFFPTGIWPPNCAMCRTPRGITSWRAIRREADRIRSTR